jgi:membrane protein required for colicin V production
MPPSAVFAQITTRIAEQDPEAALGWVTRQYEQLVGTCGAPATAIDAAAPGADTAPDPASDAATD